MVGRGRYLDIFRWGLAGPGCGKLVITWQVADCAGGAFQDCCACLPCASAELVRMLLCPPRMPRADPPYQMHLDAAQHLVSSCTYIPRVRLS